MVEIEPYKMRERTNLTEHNDIINKVNEIVDVINDVDLDGINTRLTNDESQIAVNTTDIKTNSDAIASVDKKIDTEISTVNTKIDTEISKVDYRLDGHDSAIFNLREKDTALENAMPKSYTLYRDGTGKIKAQVETIDGSLMTSNTLDMIIPYQYDIISGTTDRSFKLNITMSDGSSYTTNDFVIPSGGGTDITVTGITLSKDATNVNRFHVGINLSDGSMIDSGFITIVDSVSGTFSDNKLVITVNGVSSVPIGIDTTGTVYTAGNGITIANGSISIDSTVVALKTDISDMETKTNASATYATKTALATTDATVETVKTTANEAKSTADDANNKVNSAIDNVSVSGSTMTFTKINDEHIDVEIPSSSIPTYECNVTTDSFTVTSSGKIGYGTSNVSVATFYMVPLGKAIFLDGKIIKVGEVIVTGTYSESSYGIFSDTDRNRLANQLLSNILNVMSDGSYCVEYASLVSGIYYPFVRGAMNVTIANHEIINASKFLNCSIMGQTTVFDVYGYSLDDVTFCVTNVAIKYS